MSLSEMTSAQVTVLAGGVGGAKFADGAATFCANLTVVVNTGDDLVRHGLAISPDLDTVLYTLAGLVNPDTGWGIANDTHTTLAALQRLGVDTWFSLGDQDLATHILRTEMLRSGATLAAVTASLAASLGVRTRLLPMTNDRVATLVDIPGGRLEFQEYFVARRHQDAVVGLTYDGAAAARPAPGVLAAVTDAEVVVIAPSNPLLSIAPVLAVPGIREALCTTPARRVAISPIVGGRALKGPAAAVLEALGHEVSPYGVALFYRGLIDVMCLDEQDAGHAGRIKDLGIETVVTDTVMDAPGKRAKLARRVLTELL